MLSNITNRPFTQWYEGVSSLSSTFTVIVIPVLQSAFFSCHFQQVPGATFPPATTSQKSWSSCEDPGISSTHAPHYKTTNGFVRSGLWLKLCPRQEDKTMLRFSSSRAGRFHDAQPVFPCKSMGAVPCKSNSSGVLAPALHVQVDTDCIICPLLAYLLIMLVDRGNSRLCIVNCYTFPCKKILLW